MNFIDIQSALKSVSKLEIAAETTSSDASAAMNMLCDFNQCTIGLVSFSGATPWERHPDDELLHILEGEVAVTIIDDSKVSEAWGEGQPHEIAPTDFIHQSSNAAIF